MRKLSLEIRKSKVEMKGEMNLMESRMISKMNLMKSEMN